MAAPENEEELLRSVALQNASSILLARQRVEEELARANEALELKTQELAHSLEKTRASEARKTAILETALDSIITCDHQGIILEFNPAAERTFGLSRADAIGRDMSELIVPHHLRESHRRGMAQYLITGEGPILNRRIEMTALRADGNEFPVELAVTRILGEGQPLFTAHIRDITDRKLAQETLEKQSEWLRVTLTSIGDGVITTDTLGCVTSLNPVAESLTGWTHVDAHGEPLERVFRIMDEQSRSALENPATRSLREGKIVGLANHTILIAKDGSEHAIDDSAAPIKDGQGKTIGVVLIFRDVSGKRQNAVENARLLAALKESDRRKDEFLAMLAHELRNPLAPIRNSVQIFRAKGPPIPELQWATEVIDRQVHQMTRLVEDLLDVSRITRGKIELRKERTELSAIVNSAVEASRPLIEKWDHELTVTIPLQPIELEADVTRLAQVLLNLLNNAAKYTDTGGRIWVTAELHGHDVEIRVKDTGIGIPAEMLPRIFDMFTQVDRSLERSEGGLGIGLTLVQRLVELHGGTIEAHSGGPGKGSEFVVRLPIAGAAVKQGLRVTGESEKVTTPAPCRILVVDDNRDAADSLGMLLRMKGNDVHTAHDGLEAVGAAAAFQPDVVLLDIGLPKLNGYEAARRIKEQDGGSDMVLIALTGWGQEGDRRRSQEAGFDHHMTKPVDFAALQKLLADSTRKRGPRSRKR